MLDYDSVMLHDDRLRNGPLEVGNHLIRIRTNIMAWMWTQIRDTSTLPNLEEIGRTHRTGVVR